MTESEYWIWLASIDISPIKKVRLLKKFEKVEKIFYAAQTELLKTEDMSIFDTYEIEKSKNVNLIKKYEDYINKNKIKVININDKHYPEKLKKIYDPPVVLFVKGNIDMLNADGIAVVGSRDANEYGLKQSYRLSFELAKNDVAVISRAC